MVTWRLKACPRCQGDAFVDRDVDGWYEQCLLCGYRRGLKELNVHRQPVAAGRPEEDDTA